VSGGERSLAVLTGGKVLTVVDVVVLCELRCGSMKVFPELRKLFEFLTDGDDCLEIPVQVVDIGNDLAHFLWVCRS